MTKFLLAFMLLFAGVKFLTNYSVFACKIDFSKLVLENEEDTKEKIDQEKSKYYNEDKACPRSMLSLSIIGSSLSLQPTLPEDIIRAFACRPTTPPPDVA